jgi:hypothetical protein
MSAGTDPDLDRMLREVLKEQEPQQQPESAKDFARLPATSGR